MSLQEHSLVVNVDVAIVSDGDLLVIERGPGESHAAGELAFPGGKVEPSADFPAIESTARREVAEEVGITVGDIEYVTSKTFVADDGTPCLNVVVTSDHTGDEAHVAAPEEIAAIEWQSPEDIRENPSTPPYLTTYLDAIEATLADR